MEKTLRLQRNWASPENEERLMKRLHEIVSGGPDGPFKKNDGYNWQLDSANDWWAELRRAVDDKPDEKTILVLCARYQSEQVVLDVLHVVSALVDHPK